MLRHSRNESRYPIEPDVLYPLAVFKRHTGLGDAALRSARRNGLRVLRVGGRGSILGSDFIEYVNVHGSNRR
jgi:hypothetical protein